MFFFSDRPPHSIPAAIPGDTHHRLPGDCVDPGQHRPVRAVPGGAAHKAPVRLEAVSSKTSMKKKMKLEFSCSFL